MPNVTLFIPSLVPPFPAEFAQPPAPECPALEVLLARAQASVAPCDSGAQWLCETFGVGRQRDWPVAPIALRGEGRDPGASYWLCADPVHLRVQRDQLVLLPPASLPVTAEEAHALIDALNRHFAADGLEFSAPHPQRWYLRVPSLPEMQTVALEQAMGRDINRLLPGGADRMRYHHVFNEVQMLLHGHPVNDARERAGALPINSVWLHAGGTLPAPGRASWSEALGDTPLLRGLCELSGVPVSGLRPASAIPASGEALVVLPQLPLDDLQQWADQVQALDRTWLAPLLLHLRRGALARLSVATVDRGQARRWVLSRGDLWKVWRRPAPISGLLREGRS